MAETDAMKARRHCGLAAVIVAKCSPLRKITDDSPSHLIYPGKENKISGFLIIHKKIPSPLCLGLTELALQPSKEHVIYLLVQATISPLP
ncbi:hypothetical protein ACTXT7_011917 [Hymenolepis weldensis]